MKYFFYYYFILHPRSGWFHISINSSGKWTVVRYEERISAIVCSILYYYFILYYNIYIGNGRMYLTTSTKQWHYPTIDTVTPLIKNTIYYGYNLLYVGRKLFTYTNKYL